MSQATLPDEPDAKPGDASPAPRPAPGVEPHPAIPQEDDPEIEKTEEQPS